MLEDEMKHVNILEINRRKQSYKIIKSREVFPNGNLPKKNLQFYPELESGHLCPLYY